MVSQFLKDTYYKDNHFINTKGRTDLVVHNGKDAKSTVGVIIEAKKPTNKSEMLRKDKINSKALQELVLYYLRERITQKNLEIKYVVATNIYEWFIFDASIFEKEFAQNKVLVKQFTDFEEVRLSGTKTDFFYKEIAEPAIENIKNEIEFTYFDIREYNKPLRNDDKKDDNKLIALYKLLSPEHLLKLPFINDSNSLDKSFYTELLHIIGLSETKEGSKKLIGRKPESERDQGSLLENAMTILKVEDCLSQVKASNYGENREEQLYNVALELVIIWINRILFLKLLEGQLIKYHKGDNSYKFLNFEQILDYDALNKLFFQVLAIKESERTELVKKRFGKIPYLNSSLFEPNELEHKTVRISNLEDEYSIPLLSSTVLKDKTSKRQKGEKNTLEYLFSFLDSYDFASEGAEDIQEDNKRLINASVLGLIFEKINGYKDGSFFTPGFITMYMARETIRRAVVQKFNEVKNWECKNFNELYDKIENKKETNDIINSLKICDPAVGSVHFLVSALNEIIAIKSELKVLLDGEGKTLRDYHVEVVNDELIVSDEDGLFFEYNPTNRESQRVQETLFHEKQTIIENCLFGVDINPNSVKICRLRLWIELLKNAYYRQGTEELETLPNIDINIKCGNSLISRYDLDADIKKALKKSKWNIESYRLAVMTYRNAKSKEEKQAMIKLIDQIKNDFESEIATNDKRVIKINKLKGELFALTTQTTMFELTKKEKTEWNKKVKKLTEDINKLESELEEIRNNRIYENAFEWRFEFPEVLNDDGDFAGFDMVIGNPPYVQLQSIKELSKHYEKLGFSTYSSMGDLYALFYEKGNEIIKTKGLLCFISGSAWMRTNYGKNLRIFFNTQISILELIDLSDCDIFDSATVLTNILIFEKSKDKIQTKAIRFTRKDQSKLTNLKEIFDNEHILIDEFTDSSWIISDKATFKIKAKVEEQGTKLIDWDIKINRGILTGYNEAFIINSETKDELIAKDQESINLLKPLVRGRDVKKYYCDFQNLWLITTFPSKDIDIEKYKIVKEYLASFGKRLEQTGEKGSRKNTSGKWFETQDSISYWEDFEKPKIIYSELTKFLYFAFDNYNLYIDKTAFILTGEDLEYLVSFLNSKLFKFCFAHNFSEIQGNTRVLSKVFFEQLPIKRISKFEQKPFIDKVNRILNTKKQNLAADTSVLEKEIDQLVYELYGLTQEEIEIVENSAK